MKCVLTVRTGVAMCGWLYLAIALASAAPLSTAFTYQGQLKNGGIPADGDYDMRFSLFNAASAGATIAGPLIFDGAPGNGASVDVTNGLFHVVLDFGPVYDGTALWLHIEVRTHGVGGYTALTPRQPLTATPFAIFALDGPGQAGFWQANGNSIYKTNSGNVGIGATDPQANLEVRASGTPRLRVAKIHSGGFGVTGPAVLDLKSNFVGSDKPYGVVNFLDGNDTVRGSVEYGLAPGLLTPVSLRLGTAGQTRMAITDAGNVGIGTIAPAVKLQVEGGADASLGGGGFAVLGPTTGQNMAIDNNEIMTRNNGSPATMFLNHDGGSVVIGGNAADPRLGLGTSLPTERLDLGGGNIAMGYEVITNLTDLSATLAYALCPSGKTVISGGCNCGTDDFAERFGPVFFADGNGWECKCAGTVISATAICANIK